MIANTTVRARINDQVKNEAAYVLAAMGLTISDAFRIMLIQIAQEKRLPFKLMDPNDQTIKAMKEARRGKLVSFNGIKSLMDDLNENH
jgi:DNA-damage-inducible protein J